MQTRTVIILLFLVSVAGITSAFALRRPASVPAPSVSANATTPLKSHFTCEGGMSIWASFYEGSTTPPATSDMPPTPGGKVVITLDDGRVLSLPQTLSGSGARYANANESVVAWNKGDELMFEENGTSTYLGCIASSTQR